MPGDQDYKALYSDLKRRTMEYTRKTDAKMSKQAQLTEKFDKEMESYVLNFGQKEKFLTLENERLKKTIEEISENNSKEVDSMTKNYEDIISKHNGVIAEKDAFIKTLEEKLKNMETKDSYI